MFRENGIGRGGGEEEEEMFEKEPSMIAHKKARGTFLIEKVRCNFDVASATKSVAELWASFISRYLLSRYFANFLNLCRRVSIFNPQRRKVKYSLHESAVKGHGSPLLSGLPGQEYRRRNSFTSLCENMRKPPIRLIYNFYLYFASSYL